MKTVLLRGPLLSVSGYGQHSRQVAKWLYEKEQELDLEIYTDILRWGNTPWITDVDAEDGLVKNILNSSTDKKPKYDITIQVQLPNEWDPKLGDFNIGVTAAVETDKCNPQWVQACNQMSLIIVPSDFTESVLRNSGPINTPVVVIPECFPEAVLNETLGQVAELDLKTSFNFLVVGQLTGNSFETDRKNIPNLVRYFRKAFEKDGEDVGVVIKTNTVLNSEIDRHHTINTFAQILKATELPNGGGPTFYLLHGNMTEDEMNSLYRNKDLKAYVSLTRGEGWNLSCLEAAATGMPVISTNWSAHTEYLKDVKWLPVEYKLTPVHESKIDNNIFMNGVSWAEANENHFIERVRKFRNGSALPKEWALEGAPKLKEKYSFKAVAEKYDEALKFILEL